MAAPLRKKRKRKTPYMYGIAGGLALAFTFFYSLSFQTISPAPLLTVPVVVGTFLPGPLTMKHIDSSVLGAEDIDPLDIIRYANIERAAVGSSPLRAQQLLMKAAKMRADIIMKYQNFSHQDPHEGITLATVLPLVGYNFVYASENIGMGDSTAKAFINGFMHSPSHKANLLDPRLQDTGVAVVEGPYQQYYVNLTVHLFAIPAGTSEKLGYSAEDLRQYREAKIKIEEQLFKAQMFSLLHTFDGSEYHRSWTKLLTEQKTIVDRLILLMDNQRPFTTGDVAMIRQYNDNWTRAPEPNI